MLRYVSSCHDELLADKETSNLSLIDHDCEFGTRSEDTKVKIVHAEIKCDVGVGVENNQDILCVLVEPR